MDGHLWKKADTLFHQALELPEKDRGAFLNEQCNDCPELKALVLKLLSGYQNLDQDFLEPDHRNRLIEKLTPEGLAEGRDANLGRSGDSNQFDTALSRLRAFCDDRGQAWHDVFSDRALLETGSLDRFRLGEKLGEGGMGVVYKAEQEAPVRRTVAIKILQRSLSTKLRQRFQIETQSLSLLSEHPYIATLFEAGTTNAGCPFFVVEYIPGQSCAQYCDENQMRIGERLSLFSKICEGVSHAHVNGIIHRDLKPSNILVSRQGDHHIPKIIDFGIAKIVAPGRWKSPLTTSTHMFLGTPQYMSPEQVTNSKTVDMRSDVYSLGVLLFEIVFGFCPYDFPDGESDPLAIRQIIADAPPISIRKRLAVDRDQLLTIAKNRRTTATALLRLSRQDLHWIIRKAMAPEPGQRYQSVAAFAADIDRYVDAMPVQARAPSLWYNFRTFSKRHRMVLIPVIALVLLVLSNLLTTHLNLARVRAIATELDQSLANEKRLTKGNEDVMGYLARVMSATDPHTLGPNAPLLLAFEKAEPYLSSVSPGAEVQIRNLAARGYLTLNQHKKAQSQLSIAVPLAFKKLGPHHPTTLEASLIQIVLDHQTTGDHGDALAKLIDLAKFQEQYLGITHPIYFENLSRQAWLLTEQGRNQEAIELYQTLIDRAPTVPNLKQDDILSLQSGMAVPMFAAGKRGDALSLLEQTLARQIETLNENDRAILTSENNLALLLKQMGQTTRARNLFETVLRKRKEILGIHHLDTMATMRRLALLYREQGETQKALQLFQEALSLYLEDFPNHQISDKLLNSYGGVLSQAGQFQKAEATFQALIAFREKKYGISDERTLRAKNNLADVYIRKGQPDRAEPLVLFVLEKRRQNHLPYTRSIAYSLYTLGEIQQKQGLDASGSFCDAWHTAKEAETKPAIVAQFQGKYGEALFQAGFYEQAFFELTRALEQFPDAADQEAQNVLAVLSNLCEIWDGRIRADIVALR